MLGQRGPLKEELVHLHGSPTRARARRAIFEFIEALTTAEAALGPRVTSAQPSTRPEGSRQREAVDAAISTCSSIGEVQNRALSWELLGHTKLSLTRVVARCNTQ